MVSKASNPDGSLTRPSTREPSHKHGPSWSTSPWPILVRIRARPRRPPQRFGLLRRRMGTPLRLTPGVHHPGRIELAPPSEWVQSCQRARYKAAAEGPNAAGTQAFVPTTPPDLQPSARVASRHRQPWAGATGASRRAGGPGSFGPFEPVKSARGPSPAARPGFRPGPARPRSASPRTGPAGRAAGPPPR